MFNTIDRNDQFIFSDVCRIYTLGSEPKIPLEGGPQTRSSWPGEQDRLRRKGSRRDST